MRRVRSVFISNFVFHSRFTGGLKLLPCSDCRKAFSKNFLISAPRAVEQDGVAWWMKKADAVGERCLHLVVAFDLAARLFRH